MAQNKQIRSKYYCCTLNNYTNEEYEKLKTTITDHCSYGVVGKEKGDSGTPHLQIYIELKTRKRWSAVKNLLDGRFHIEPRKGNALQASDYCKKDGDFWEHGELSNSKQGKRNDIDNVRALIKDGLVKNESDLLDVIKSQQAFLIGKLLLSKMYRPPDRAPPTVYWIHGATGTGKSRAVSTLIKRLHEIRKYNYWRSPHTIELKWYDGYMGQEIAWFDDIRWNGKMQTFVKLLNLTDRYHCNVEVKGSMTIWEPKFILFTSAADIGGTFAGSTEDIQQLNRRVTDSFNFNRREEITRFNSLIDQYVHVVDNEGEAKHDEDEADDEGEDDHEDLSDSEDPITPVRPPRQRRRIAPQIRPRRSISGWSTEEEEPEDETPPRSQRALYMSQFFEEEADASD